MPKYVSKFRDQAYRQNAGKFYDEMRGSRESTLAHLSNPSPSVRSAALHISDNYWDGAKDPAFLGAWRRLGLADPSDGIRGTALMFLGSAFAKSKDLAESRFLAQIVLDPNTPKGVRWDAYQALRCVQQDVSLTDAVESLAVVLKEAIQNDPASKEATTRAAEFRLRHPEVDWENAGRIDVSFVQQFLKSNGGDPAGIGAQRPTKCTTDER